MKNINFFISTFWFYLISNIWFILYQNIISNEIIKQITIKSMQWKKKFHNTQTLIQINACFELYVFFMWKWTKNFQLIQANHFKMLFSYFECFWKNTYMHNIYSCLLTQKLYLGHSMPVLLLHYILCILNMINPQALMKYCKKTIQFWGLSFVSFQKNGCFSLFFWKIVSKYEWIKMNSMQKTCFSCTKPGLTMKNVLFYILRTIVSFW